MKKKLIFFMKIAILSFVFTLTSLIVFYSVAFVRGKPEIGQSYTLEIYDTNFDLMYESNRKQMGGWVSLEEINPYITNGIIATEDKNFYNHYGFDFSGIIRVAYKNLTTSTTQGASTITQQYARTIFLSNVKTWERKIKEAFYAAQIEMHYSKDEILEGYLNSIYFGHGVYGIENASLFFFNKKNTELSLAEASMLVGIPNGPGYYSPLISMENSKYRQAIVIERMIKEKYITQEEGKAAYNEPIILDTNNSIINSSTMLYYKDSVIEELNKLKLLTDTNLQKGLKIYTNYDPNAQNVIEEAIDLYVPSDNDMQLAVVMVEPFTNKVIGLAGGKNYTTSQFNRALNSNRQVASTIKPFLYYTALENGFTPTTTFIDEPTDFILSKDKVYSPKNYNGAFLYDDMTMVNALGISNNIYAVKTHLFLGEENFVDFLDLYNIKANPDASLVLGTLSTSIYDMVRMYSSFASEGLYQEPYFVTAVYDSDNNLIYEHQDNTKQLLDRDLTLIMNQMLTSTFDINNTSTSTASLLMYKTKKTAAAKSGTSDWDSLIVGFNPNVVCGVWNGYDNNQALTTNDETRISRLVWQYIFDNYLNIKQENWYHPTDNLTIKKIDPVSGKLSNQGSNYWFLKGGVDLIE